MVELLHIIIVISYLSLDAGAAVDWCSAELDCKRGKKHTMCIYQPKTETPNCQSIVDAQNPQSRQKMLDLHNEYRNKIAGGEMPGWPKAANMRQMSWDSEIESIALRWAVQCTPGHDSCRRTQKFEYVGQNYGMSASSEDYPGPEGCFDGWVDEIKIIADPSGILTNFQGGKWGHFTQVVWATSNKLGCAQIHYISGPWKTTVVICDYGPGGNVETLPMYEVGEPASKCPHGSSRSKKYPNLCASPDDGKEPGGGGGGGAGGGEGAKAGGGNEPETGDGGGRGGGDNDGKGNVVRGNDVQGYVGGDGYGGGFGGGSGGAVEYVAVGDGNGNGEEKGDRNLGAGPGSFGSGDDGKNDGGPNSGESQQSESSQNKTEGEASDPRKTGFAASHRPWTPSYVICSALILNLRNKL